MKTNIVLIGLTGCGKTTIGSKLSQELHMNYVDVDEDIELHYGPIKSLFENGEEYFRNIESQRVESLSKQNNTIISTGGGVVLRASNMKTLKSTGIIFFLERPIEEIILTIDTTNRPLLKNGTEALYQLYIVRESLYRNYSDYVIQISNIDQATSTIASFWKKKL